VTEKAVEMSNDVEELQIDVRTAICRLGEASLRELCAGLQVEVKFTYLFILFNISVYTVKNHQVILTFKNEY